MAGKSNSDGRSRKRLPPLTGGRRKSCFFCKSKVDEIDYKNVGELRRYISEKGKIRSRRITGACRRHQRQVQQAIKRAREMALLPYVAEGRDDREGGGRRDRGDRGDEGPVAVMQVVLRQDVDNLGLRGEVVNVARGYARNFLLPRGLAELATPGLVRELEKRNAQRARHEAQSTEEAQAIAARLEATELRFDVNAGPTGSLFGSVTATNVADRLWEELKIRIDRRKLAVGTIKRIGRYTVPVEVFGDVTAELRLLVVPEGGELPPEEELEAAEAAEARQRRPLRRRGCKLRSRPSRAERRDRSRARRPDAG